METAVRTPMQVFNLPQHLVVPLFQRPYVWDEEEQWLPLWQDVRRLVELRLKEPYATATHFLGAIVVQAQDNQMGTLPARNVIDGQQRLTTLQLLMDATASVLEEAGLDGLASQLDVLTHNLEQFVPGTETRLKLRHTNRDRLAFDEVMSAEPPVVHASLKHAGSLVVRAHQFFVEAVREWLADESSDTEYASRATALVQVLAHGLVLVVIDLQAQENSQEIFETLNARGTPLTAADLVKNFVFQRLEAEGVDTRHAYAEDWPFESKFWETDVSVGRYTLSRSSLFLTQWLGARVGEEISPKATFARFKHYVDHESGLPMRDVLQHIRSQAEQYERWTLAAADPDRWLDPTEMAVYRMSASGIELLKPLLLWLHDPELKVPEAARDAVIAAAESWVVRRQLLRLPSADLGRIVADLIRSHRTAPAEELAERVSTHLTRLTTASSYWPGDDEVRTILRTENAYRRYPGRRLRMLLEAIENRLRSTYGSPPVPRRGYPIEHLLPQKWEDHWPVVGLEAQLDRGAHVHRLGNLTLLTTALNSAVSNGPWPAKRSKIAAHDAFLLNRSFHNGDTLEWNEAAIDSRTEQMIDALLATWPVPAGHGGTITFATSQDDTWIEVKHLVAAEHLAPGTRLIPRPGAWSSVEAVVTVDGRIDVGGVIFDSPSAAGKHVKGGVTNGWVFWRLEDGRRLADVRAAYRGEPVAVGGGAFDWSVLHALLEALPDGSWTTYGDLADVIGTAPQPLGNHIRGCSQCVNAHRVLTGEGAVASGFAWSDPAETRSPQDLLLHEGVRLIDGRADPAQKLVSDDLADLLPEDFVRPTSGTSPRQQLYRAFWTLFEPEAKARGWTAGSPPAANWWAMPTGTGGVSWIVSFATFGARSELAFGDKKPETNLARFHRLEEHRSEIEVLYGEPLIFDAMSGKVSCRIEARLAGPSIERRDEWPSYIDWFLESQERFRTAIDRIGGVPGAASHA